MYRHATKDTYEREGDEASRLVRPSPKLKPPRRDLRREHVLESDPDLEADREKEASLVSRVASRHRRKDNRVQAWSRRDKKVVLVTPKTLKSRGDIYEPYNQKDPQDKREVQKDPVEGSPADKSPKKKRKKKEEAPSDNDKAPDKGESSTDEKPSEPKEKPAPLPEGAPPPPKRPRTQEEEEEARQLALDNLPLNMFASISKANLHPDEIREIIKQYEAFVKKPLAPSARARFIADTRSNFVDDPNSVEPPEMDAKGVPFSSLKPDKQAEVMQAHRMQTYTKSLLAREMLVATYKEAGVPLEQGLVVANFHLRSNTEESIESRDNRARKLADSIFDHSLSSGKITETPDADMRSAYKELKGDPSASRLLTAHYQANDYLYAKQKFLSSDSPDAFSERSPASQIVSGIVKAGEYLTGRTKLYPADSVQHDMSAAFRVRVLARLKALAPEKYQEVRDSLTKIEVEQYKKEAPKYVQEHKQWVKDKAQYDKKLTQAQAQYEKAKVKHEADLEAWRSKVRHDYEVSLSDGAYRNKIKEHPVVKPPPDPPVMPDVGLAPKEPEKPKEPVGYIQHTTDDADVEEIRKRLWDPKTKKAGAFTYPHGIVMRTAIYNGVEPYPESSPYPDWDQAQLRDITGEDLDLILDEAKEWLKSPWGSKHFEGAPRDTQLRAALDLAIRTTRNGYYSEGLPPPVYETLFRRLAGIGNEGTLLTVANSAYISASGEELSTNSRREATMTIKLATENAEKVLARLDHIAGYIQENHEKMGMSFKTAKSLVHDLDRVADEIEVGSFGMDSFVRRQAEVLQRDTDETYMDTFKAPTAPRQTDADEPYMSAYKDDQSSAVQHGGTSTGRPLAP